VSTIERNIYDTQLAVLAHAGDKVVQHLNNLQELVYQISASVEIRKYGNTVNPLDDPPVLSVYRETFKFLQTIRLANTLFDGILFYAPKSRTILWQDGAVIRTDNSFREVFSISGENGVQTEAFLNTRYPYTYRYDFDISFLGKFYQRPLVLTYSIPTVDDNFVNLFLLVSQQKFLEPFLINAAAGEWTYVAGKAGIYFTVPSMPEELYTADLNEKMTAGTGFFIDRIGDEKVLITYMRDERNGFDYISGVPHRRVMDITRGMRLTVTVLLVLSTIGGIGIALFMAINSARPVKILYHIITGNLEPGEAPNFSYDFLNSRVADVFTSKRLLESEVNRLIPAQKQSLVYRLLNAGAGELDDILAEFGGFGIDLRGGPFCILIIAINDMDTSYGFNEISAYKVLVDKIVTKTIAENGYDYIGIFHNEIDKETIIIKSKQESSEMLIRAMEDFAASVSKNLMVQNNISITFSGCLADHAGEISRAYYGAGTALGYENRNKNRCILWFDAQSSSSISLNDTAEAANSNIGNDERTEKILQHIAKHFTDSQISLVSVADEFSITEFYLSHLFKEKTGINFSKYLEKLRMEYAQTLLSEKQYKVVDAAREVGYSSHQSFGRAYRKYYGKSPSAYNNRPV
jgi:AraC-like DNA-binding protein